MGGVGSTRWGWRSTRATTDECLALDVRALARRGYFAARTGESATGIETWRCDGKEVGRVGVRYHGDDPHAITLEYRVCWPGEEWHTIRERVELNQTACALGGVRRWFVCAGCKTRRALLLCVGGLFRCRLCHDLAYRSTRQRPVDRTKRRADKGRPRIGEASA